VILAHFILLIQFTANKAEGMRLDRQI